ncbi:MAG: hypothetical protein ABIG95_03910, partial [Candidatus Woesearchaeota archaeon]
MKPAFFLCIFLLFPASTACGTLSVLPKKTLFEAEPIRFSFSISPKPSEFTIQYWVEDLYSNIVKKRLNTSSLSQKSFTPKITQPYLLKAILVGCPEANASALVVFKANTTLAQSERFGYRVYAPRTIFSNTTFEIEIELQNEDQILNLSIWSYIYRGSKVYSLNRTFNLQKTILQPNEARWIKLIDKADAQPGSYSLKINIQKNSQRPLQTTRAINVTSILSQQTAQLSIANVYLNSSTIVCQLNNSHQVTKEVELVLESLYNTQTQTITLEPERLTAVS